MSATSTRSQQAPSDTFSVNGVDYRRVNTTYVYQVHDSRVDVSHGSLIDGGANGGLLGSDARILEQHLSATADVIGLADTVLSKLPIVQAAAKVETLSNGPIIAILSSYAHRSDGGRTIHSKGQLESFGLIVDDKSSIIGGSQCIITNEGYIVPLYIADGLTYLDMTVPTDTDLATYPHVFFCADAPWNPSTLDSAFPVETFEVPAAALERRENLDSRVDAFGSITLPPRRLLSAFPQRLQPNLADIDVLRPNFG